MLHICVIPGVFKHITFLTFSKKFVFLAHIEIFPNLSNVYSHFSLISLFNDHWLLAKCDHWLNWTLEADLSEKNWCYCSLFASTLQLLETYLVACRHVISTLNNVHCMGLKSSAHRLMTHWFSFQPHVCTWRSSQRRLQETQGAR